MTVSSEQSFIEYNGDGATQTFAVPFYFILNSDISVTVADASGNLDELTYGVDFSASGGGNPDGGTATLNTAYASGYTILIYRNPPETQETAYYENGKFPAKSHEKALDKLTMLIQKYGWWFDSLALKKPSYLAQYYDAQGNRIANLADPVNQQDAATKKYTDIADQKSLRVPENSVGLVPSVNSRKNKLLAFDDNGDPIAVLPESGSASDVLADLAMQGSDKKIGSSYGATVWADYERCEFQRKNTFASGDTLSSSNQVMQDASGLWWFYTGTFPKFVAPGTNPSSDSLWYCAGLLNGWPLNNCRAWYQSSSTTDNTAIIQSFLRTMTYLQLTAYMSGDVLTSSRVTADCDIDASGCTWYISPDSDNTVSGGGGKVLLIEDVNTVVLTGQSFATSNVGQISHVQLSGASFSNTTVGVEGEGDVNRAYYRGTFGTYTNAADLYVMDGGTTGNHPDTEALFRFYGTSKFTVRPQRPRRTIKGAKFVLTAPLSGGRSLRTCIAIERNNTSLLGGYFDAQQSGLIAESYVQLTFVTDCMVEGVSMPNELANSNYTVLCYGTNRITVRNCHAASGWALVDGNFMRNTLVEDSSGATIGCHAMAWNFTVRRCTLVPVLVAGKYQGGISVTGGGTLLISDIVYTYLGGDRQLDHPVSTRGDYGQSWEGDVYIERVTLRVGAVPPSGQGISVFYANGADLGAIDMTRDCYLGGKRAVLKDIRIQILNSAWAAADLVISPMWPQTTFTQNVRYPSDYIVDGWIVETSGPGYTLDPRWITLVTNTNAVIGTTRNAFRNVQWPGTSIGFIGPAAATTYRITPEIIIEDSRSGFYINQLALPNGGRFTIRRSTIGNMVLGNANGNGEYFIDHCFIGGSNAGGSPGSADKAYYYQNHITTTNAVTVGSIAKYCHGNTVVTGGSVVGRTLDEWYSYRDSSVFRLS